jgi:D-serine deaminase-like pyridoxal phosphate-dependent protein
MIMAYEHLIGRHKSEIDTPALLLYMDVVEKNILRMADFFQGKECKLRPHIKTHKLPLIARRQLAAGAIGITCAKLGEAMAFQDAGIGNILIANEVVGSTKIRALVRLMLRSEVMVCVDNLDNAEQLSAAAGEVRNKVAVLVEVNVGLNRCGVPPGKPALELVRRITRLKNLEFRGLMGYEGGLFIKEVEEKVRRCSESNRLLVETRQLIEQDGFEVQIATAGGSNTYSLTGTYPGITDVQVGSYVTMDDHSREYGMDYGQAVTVLSTVISRPEVGRAVIDAGKKSLSTDEGLPVCVEEGIAVSNLNEEHGHLSVTIPELRPGDKIEIIPRHGCTTIPLFDRYFVIRNDQVESVEPILARGASQ